MVKKYLKKPIPIEAIQFNGSNLDELQQLAGNHVFIDHHGYLNVKTLEGIMQAPNKLGDYLIKGAVGEFYICEKSVFEKTYEEFNESRLYICSQMMY